MQNTMKLLTGTRLGPYEIVARVGAGGMGEVYRARDTRLDRSVAIKVLHSEITADGTLRIRFDREAKAVSGLGHPNICALYDVGREGDLDYLVMEFCEGETLADHLARGRLPLDDVLKYGTNIGDALARAHQRGIVHRDLKPSNVILTKSGAKVLDFGLAKHSMPPARYCGVCRYDGKACHGRGAHRRNGSVHGSGSSLWRAGGRA